MKVGETGVQVDQGAASLQLPDLSIEQRITAIEEKIKRFENAMFGAAKMLLDNPMASAMIPKEMKATLREYLS